ncbi:MAG: hypothetical protein ACLPSW_31575 [Roseiarcus sp.]
MTPFRLADAERDGPRYDLKFAAFTRLAIAGLLRARSLEPPAILGDTDA